MKNNTSSCPKNTNEENLKYDKFIKTLHFNRKIIGMLETSHYDDLLKKVVFDLFINNFNNNSLLPFIQFQSNSIGMLLNHNPKKTNIINNNNNIKENPVAFFSDENILNLNLKKESPSIGSTHNKKRDRTTYPKSNQNILGVTETERAEPSRNLENKDQCTGNSKQNKKLNIICQHLELKHYAKGYCRKCYFKKGRKKQNPLPENKPQKVDLQIEDLYPDLAKVKIMHLFFRTGKT